AKNINQIENGLPGCVFWNTKTLTWSSDGCELVTNQTTSLDTHCKCDHIASAFAAVEIPVIDQVIEDIESIRQNVISKPDGEITDEEFKESIKDIADLVSQASGNEDAL